MPVFSPGFGGCGMPIGRFSGFGVNSSTRLPYDLGASSNGEGGITLAGAGEAGVSVLAGLLLAAGFTAFVVAGACSASKRYEVLNALDWQSRHRSLGLRASNMIRGDIKLLIIHFN